MRVTVHEVYDAVAVCMWVDFHDHVITLADFRASIQGVSM